MKEFIESLNDYAGLFSLLAVIVPILLYLLGRRDYKKTIGNKLEASKEHYVFPMSESERERQRQISAWSKELK